MQKYQFQKTSHTQNTFFIHTEATENTFLPQKKVVFHAEHETLKKICFTSGSHFEDYDNN